MPSLDSKTPMVHVAEDKVPQIKFTLIYSRRRQQAMYALQSTERVEVPS